MLVLLISMRSHLSSLGLAIIALSTATTASFATPAQDQLIWSLLDQDKPFASLPGEEFLALGQEFALPDRGKTVTALALAAPGGAFDPRDLESIPAATLGYSAKWCVERFPYYNLDWDITGLRLTSNDPDASKYPWLVIMNGGAANVYEFYVDLKSQPGWGQFLAQKLNVLIVSIPGNFKYDGWSDPIESEARQPAYLLDEELSLAENNVRHAIYTNRMIMAGIEKLVTNHTTGDLFMIGHSTSGELAFLAYEYPELASRLKGRFLGWGSGAPARLHAIRAVKEPQFSRSSYGRSPPPLEQLNRRSAEGYSGPYSRWLNPLYEAGDSTYQIAEKWMAAEGVRRPMFKQPMQDLEHSAGGWNRIGDVTRQIEELLEAAGNPWGIQIDDVAKDLFSTAYTRLDGFNQMVWCVAHYDRNHWVPETPLESWEVFIANELRDRNPDAKVRIMIWDLPMTHYGHVEKPRELAAAFYSVVRWFK